MAYTPPPLDPTPYGTALAERVTTQLEGGHSLRYSHRDYCGMGLELMEGHYCYGEIYDMGMYPFADMQKELAEKGPEGSPVRLFAARAAFVEWLAKQSDESLARLECPQEFYRRNQTLDRARLMEFLTAHEVLPQITLPRWTRLWQGLGAKTSPSEWFGGVLGAYSESHRHYHTLRHINACLEELDHVASQAAQPFVLEAALWLHDSLYEPQSQIDAEARSAEFADDVLSSGGIKRKLIADVRALILVTKKHVPNATPDAALMCDIDLAILGQDEATYEAYEQAIRKEYEWVPAKVFGEKRAEILQGFLNRERLYHTPSFYDQYEAPARRNLAAAIQKLQPNKKSESRGGGGFFGKLFGG